MTKAAKALDVLAILQYVHIVINKYFKKLPPGSFLEKHLN